MIRIFNFRVLIILLLIGLWVAPLNAQSLTKAEKKALKKELKQYKKDPESYKAMIDKKNSTIDTLNKEVEELKAERNGLKEENLAMLDSMKGLNAKYTNLVARAEAIADPRKLPKGTVYQVQVGYYKNIDFTSFNSTVRAVKAEATGNARRYVIGYFESQADAMAFSEDLRLMGISDAFVTQYTNGKRNMNFDAYRN